MKHATTVRIALVAGFFLVLEALARFGIVPKRSMVPPSDMVTTLADLMRHPPFWDALAYTSVSIAVSLVLAVVFGFIGGVILHRLPRTRRALEPLIASYYALPFFVLYPLFIVLWGMNAIPIIFVGFIYAVMAMLTATLSGLDRIPSVLRSTGRAFRLSPVREAVFIQLPAATPYLLTGIKLALGYAITGVVGSEFILSNNGLGYAIAYAYNSFDDRRMYALLLFLIVLVTIITILLHMTERNAQHRGGGVKIEEHPGTLRERATATLMVIVVLLVAWEVLHWKVGDEALAAPGATFRRLGEFLAGGTDFWANVAETGKALGLSLLISCVAGILVGVMIGLSRAATEIVEPILVTFYALPKVTLYPVVLLFFGIGLSAKVAFGALYGMIPMILITINAIASMNPVYGRTARIMNLTRLQKFFTLILPATLPEIIGGLRISFSITLLGVMIGEMFASRRGLGFMIMNSMGVNDTATMMAVTVLVGTFAVVMNRFLTSLDSRLLGQRGARRNEAQPVQG